MDNARKTCHQVPGTEAVVVARVTGIYWEAAGAPGENKTAVGSVLGRLACSEAEEQADSGPLQPSGL